MKNRPSATTRSHTLRSFRAAQTLLGDPLRRIAGLSKQFRLAAAEILMQFHCQSRHSSGTNSSSRASAAA